MGLIQRAKTLAYALFATFRHQPKDTLGRHRRPTAQLRNAEFSLTATQVRSVIAAARSPRDTLILSVFAETGIRRSELIDLRWEDIDFANKLLVIRNGKGSKMRVVPVTADTAQILMLQLTPDATGFVFRSRQSAKLSAQQVSRIVARAGINAGIKHPNPRHQHLTCHLLRHTFARLWKMHHGSIESLSKILGHSSVKTTWDEYGRESLTDVQRNYDSTIHAIYRKNNKR